MTTTYYITTGFLTGNLWEGADPATYAAELSEYLQRRFPGAAVEVSWQRGTGSLPWSLLTHVYPAGLELPAGAPDERDVDYAVTLFDSMICNDEAHPVWASSAGPD